MLEMTDEEKERLRIHLGVRKTPAHIPITHLVTACIQYGTFKGKDSEARFLKEQVERRRDELGLVIVELFERMRKAEAMLDEFKSHER